MTKTDKPELTPKQQRFAEEYLIDLNATQAAIRAGYSENSAKDIACENLAKPNIADAIANAQQERSERTQVKADDVVRELARIGFSDIRKAFTENGNLRSPTNWDDETAAAISSIEVVARNTGQTDEIGNKVVERVHKLRFWDKNSSLEKLAKHLGMFTEKREVLAEITVKDERSPQDQVLDYLSEISDRRNGISSKPH